MFGAPSNISYGTIFTIAADAVVVALLEHDILKDTPHVVWSTKQAVMRAKDAKQQVAQVTEALKRASLEVEKAGFVALKTHNSRAKVTKALAVFAAPWSATVPRRVQFEDGKEFEVTQKLLNDLGEAAEEQLHKEVEAQTLGDALGFETIATVLVDTKVNGYDIDEPIGTTGTLLEITEVHSLVRKDIKAAVSLIVERLLPHADLSFATQAFANYSVLSGLQDTRTSFGILHVCGETTEIGLAEKDVLLAVHHVPYGSATLLREICTNTNVPEGHVTSQLCLLEEGALDDSVGRDVSKHFKGYDSALEKGARIAAARYPFPRTVYVLADVPFKETLATHLLTTLKKVTGQTHVATSTEHLRLHNSGSIALDVAAHFFHQNH